jgi:hypothetical protein
MTRTEIHDVTNIVAPAISLSQSLLLGFYGELAQEQKTTLAKIKQCLKDLQNYLQQQALKGEQLK